MKKLTPREQEVMELSSQKLSNALIAARLNISINTVKQHRLNAKQTDLHLTRREHDVMYYTVQGMSGKQLCKTLGIEHKTVQTHKNNLYRKLEVHTNKQLCEYYRNVHKKARVAHV